MRTLNQMEVVVERLAVLKTLRANREKHAAIVAEARIGFVKKARTVLEEKLARVKEGQLTSLNVFLTAPRDNTKVYDTAIKMLEMHQNDTITLNSTQVRNLVMDEWDWTAEFLTTNSAYSETAAAVAESAAASEEF